MDPHEPGQKMESMSCSHMDAKSINSDVWNPTEADWKLTKHYSKLGVVWRTVESSVLICDKVALIANNCHTSER